MDMRRGNLLDGKDLKIISMLSSNPDVSQEAIANEVKLSQPAVGMRLKKLKRMNILSHQYGLNLQGLGMCFAKVDLTAKNPKEVLKMFENCPAMYNGFVTSGKHNLSLLLVRENLSSLQSLIDHHLKDNVKIEDVEDNVVVSWSRQMLYPINFSLRKETFSPCGANCRMCPSYKSNDCLGCILTVHYKGRFAG